ncbi:hypothetical protein EJ08DRAFT_582513 [Tothia fuscella]|uniref:CCR4-NOT transcription complex subunit 4 n=1 Tax=Tothia fuscella TaxID=1048955 RepID=A0A9P4NZT9_9PEZI|nr:hypothetical protein EJ08DRAFT_582513 [Tothia fuscella]
MARPQQDQFIDEDEEEECCPLCVEELDLGDKNFRPCPCGYQICQFCYNNIKTTMNGLCPACRRPYDDKPFFFKQVSPDEIAAYALNKAQAQKKRVAAKQKEAQKREADNLSRKHLSGLRVRQKNLVYVTGMKPKIQGDRVAELLRSREYFGQYGEIIKIVVAKSKDNVVSLNQPIGIYVTFARKDDAAACIEAINSQSGDGKMRAQHGTTKYCSAYLRGDTCNNRNCMFLHEPGENDESFSRQDLSSLNAAGTQQSISQSPDSQTLQLQPPPQHAQPIAAAIQEDQPTSPTDSSIDNSALPAGANWGNQVRRESRSTVDSNASPMASALLPVGEAGASPSREDTNTESNPTRPASPVPVTRQRNAEPDPFHNLLKLAFNPKIKWSFAPNGHSEEDIKVIENMPPLWDPRGGEKRRLAKQRNEELARQQEEVQLALPAPPNPEAEEQDDGPAGSHQLGGEPEDRPERNFGGQGQHAAIHPPSGFGSLSINQSNLGQQFGLGDDLSTNSGSTGRVATPQQDIFMRTQRNQPAQAGPSSHGRNGSRMNFQHDGTAKPTKMLQQHSVLGQSNTNIYQQQSQYYNSMPNVPPGFKATGTPPVSGGGMFGQGHGFTGGYGATVPGRDSDSKMWDMQRGQRVNPDAAKREYFSNFIHSSTSTPAPGPGHLNYSYGAQPGALNAFQETGGAQKQKKKGKKHRHANTSSSGGGGVVDGADPSILQARLHPIGASGMTGQGQYGGAGQGLGGFPSMYGNMRNGGW